MASDAVGRLKVAVIGCGLIGQSWGLVFARAGHHVSLHDMTPNTARKARDDILRRIDAQVGGASSFDGALSSRIEVAERLCDAVGDADYVQENGPERLETKASLTAEIDAAAPDGAPIGSSTSGIPCSAYAVDTPGRARCLVVHPINPPHLIPAVELAPAPWTRPDVCERADAVMRSVGQATIRVNREVEGFVVNRLQGALLNEAFRLVAEGVVSPKDLDVAVSHGLGLRWSFMGPFETIHLNAPGGVAQYVERYGPLYHRIFGGDAQTWSRVLADGLQAWLESEHPPDAIAASQGERDAKLLEIWRQRFGNGRNGANHAG